MNLENQVCTLEQAKKLKELGVGLFPNSPINFYWIATEANSQYFLDTSLRLGGYAYLKDFVATFTVAELGVMLPNESGIRCTQSYYNDHMGQWYCEYRVWPKNEDDEKEYDESDPAIEYEEEADTEAEARAELLITLLENGKVTAQEVNARLLAA